MRKAIWVMSNMSSGCIKMDTTGCAQKKKDILNMYGKSQIINIFC